MQYVFLIRLFNTRLFIEASRRRSCIFSIVSILNCFDETRCKNRHPEKCDLLSNPSHITVPRVQYALPELKIIQLI